MTSAAIPVTPRTAVTIAVASVVGVLAFGWPLLANANSALVAHSNDAPWLMVALLPLVLAVVLADIADGGMDAKAVAILGVMIAVIAALTTCRWPTLVGKVRSSAIIAMNLRSIWLRCGDRSPLP